jgi:hypothetical protein
VQYTRHGAWQFSCRAGHYMNACRRRSRVRRSCPHHFFTLNLRVTTKHIGQPMASCQALMAHVTNVSRMDPTYLPVIESKKGSRKGWMAPLSQNYDVPFPNYYYCCWSLYALSFSFLTRVTRVAMRTHTTKCKRSFLSILCLLSYHHYTGFHNLQPVGTKVPCTLKAPLIISPHPVPQTFRISPFWRVDEEER